MPTTLKSILALDVGNRRVGIAVASLEARLARPLTTLERNDSFYQELHKIVTEEAVSDLVIGLPRGLDGQVTSQTSDTLAFRDELTTKLGLPIHLQDEALTSKQAEAELDSRGKVYNKAEIDALAATFILEDYLSNNKEALQP